MKPVKCEFTEKNLTGNAGLKNIGKFIDKLDLLTILNQQIGIERASNAKYSVADVMIMLILGVFVGALHMNHVVLFLGADLVIRKILGWDSFPCESTLGRIFKLFSPATCNAISDAENIVRRKVWKKRWFGRVTLEFDSSVKGVFGSQEGAAVGYNPKKHGQKSYHPLFCFLAETRECLHNWFRTGIAYSANGIVEFATECFERLPKGVWKVFVRADSAFFNGAFLAFLESRGAFYIIKVKLSNLTAVLQRQKWTAIRYMPGFEAAEFLYQCAGWNKTRRFVAIRKLVEVVTEGVLFPEYRYEYFCYVTNQKLPPWKIHKEYGKRATSENWIDWVKNQMAAGSILTQDFWANSAIFQACILAYNLMVWMMWLKEGRKLSEEPHTIRFWLIRVPARLLTSGRQFVLKFQKNAFFKKRWLDLEVFLDQLCFA